MFELQNFVNQFGFGISKNELCEKACSAMTAQGFDACVLNEKYLEVNGVNYQFTKNRKTNSWVVKAF